MIKRTVCVILCAVTALVFASCGAAKTETRDVSMYDLSRAMLASTGFGDMSYVSSSDDGAEDLLANVSDIDYEKVLSFFIAYASDGKGNADEIVVIATKNAVDTAEAALTLNKHLEHRREVYATYDPTQSDKVEDGTVFTADNLAVLIISGDNKAVKSAFESFIANSGK